jgi:glycolate oxidase FAD binding subunit
MPDTDLTEGLLTAVQQAAAAGRPLAIRGGGSKVALWRAARAEPLDLRGHSGILHYEPEELVLTARSGTPLTDIEAALAASSQMLAFEPPHLAGGATLGGAIASGLSGPRRPFAGAARDFVLGVRLLDGQGQVLRFGGEVMKNVAGFDVSRLMCGAFGTLGVLLDVSLKVLPRPAAEITLDFAATHAKALEWLVGWCGRPLPISGAAQQDGRLRLRLSGAASGVEAARAQLGGDAAAAQTDYWTALRDQRLSYFTAPGEPLWRLSLPPAAPMPELAGEWLLDWAGAQRWLRTPEPPERVRAAAAALGGHAVWYTGRPDGEPFYAPLPAPLLALHRRVKSAFDPLGLFNPGALYPDL